MPNTVSVREGIEYGFSLLAYILGVGVAGGIVIAIGFVLFDGGGISAAIGGLLFLVGIIVIYAGFLGIAYKVIADGVKVGIEAADGDMSGESTASTSTTATTGT
jgi:hypothetical protein